jgi:alkylation response protein AidB-like acyl-CoA dehydrogenase
MDFALSPDQQDWHDRAVALGRDALTPPPGELIERDRHERFWREGYQRCGRAGLAGLPVPKQFGGQGQTIDVAVAAMEGLGYACPDTGLAFALGASLWTITMPIVAFGTETQKSRWLPGLCDGTLFGANAASEPESGSDIFSMSTRATRRDDGSWSLAGRKIWITGGGLADLLVVFATTDPSKGVLGISTFLVPRETAGFKVVRTIEKIGLRTAPLAELAFDDCVLPPDALLGREGRGSKIFQAALEWERGAILAPMLGVMRRQLEQCVEYARKRKQSGQPIGKFQAVSHRIVAMHQRLETSRLLIHRYAWMKAQGQDATAAAALAKLHVTECFLANSTDAVRTFGALGVTTELGLERDLRDAVGGVIYSGTNDIQKNILAQSLRL